MKRMSGWVCGVAGSAAAERATTGTGSRVARRAKEDFNLPKRSVDQDLIGIGLVALEIRRRGHNEQIDFRVRSLHAARHLPELRERRFARTVHRRLQQVSPLPAERTHDMSVALCAATTGKHEAAAGQRGS